MKKRIILVIVSIILIGVVLGIVLFDCFSPNNPFIMKRKILAKCESFKGIWDMGRPQIDENGKRIKIGFTLLVSKEISRVDAENYALTSIACEEISDYLFSDNYNYREEGYQIDFCFSDNQLFHLEVLNVEPDMKNIYLSLSDDNYFPISRYTEWYPKTETLDVYSIDENTIEAIKNFSHLKRIKTGPDLTDEQRNQIMSICPNIEIEAGIY